MAENQGSVETRWSTDEEFVVFMARKLLWAQLISGRGAAWVDMTNDAVSYERVQIACFVPRKKGFALWEVWPIDHDDGHYVWSPAFGCPISPSTDWAGFTYAWPDQVPNWDEFTFGQAWPVPYEPDNDYEFESVLEGEWSGEWPELLMGSGYEHWAVLDMAARGRIENYDLVQYLRSQDDLDQIGRVEILAVGVQPAGGDAPFPDAADSVISVLSRIRGLRHGAADSEEAALVDAARHLIEPLLVITPGVPREILDFIVSEPTCPAMHLLAINSDLPESLRAIAATAEMGTLPRNWTIETRGITGGTPQLRFLQEKYKDSGDNGTLLSAGSAAGTQLEIEITALMERILGSLSKTLVENLLGVLPADSENDGDEDDESGDEDEESGESAEDTLEFSVAHHLQFLQARRWLHGGIGVPEEMLAMWIDQLEVLADQIDGEVVDSEEVARTAAASWTEFARDDAE